MEAGSSKRDLNDDCSAAERALNSAVILDVIFPNIPKNNKNWWKSARLVNKSWNSYFLSQWRKDMVYRLGLQTDCPDVKVFTTQFLEQQHPENSPNDPMQLDRHPIRNMCIRWQAYHPHTFLQLQQDQIQFWQMFGPGLRRINLEDVQIRDVTPLKTLLFECTPNLEEFSYIRCVYEGMDDSKLNTVTEYTPPAKLQKNLKVLKIKSALSFGEEWRRVVDDYKLRFPISWLEFFSMFPNIKNLNLEIDPIYTNKPSNLLKVFEAIDIIRRANNNEVLNITQLRVSGQAGFTHVDVIRNQTVYSSLPISILETDVTAMSNDQVIALIQTFDSTLRHLKLMYSPDQSIRSNLPSDVTFPEGLTKLCLADQLISSLEFLSSTPNLEELELGTISRIVPIYVRAPLVNLKKLTYELKMSRSLTPEHLTHLARVMPNVKNCSCNVDSAGFQALCQGWPNLEHLDLSGQKDFGNEDFFIGNLVRLQGLRSLKINGFIEVTDKSVFNAFLLMHSLTRIYLPRQLQISEDGFEALKRKRCVTSVQGSGT